MITSRSPVHQCFSGTAVDLDHRTVSCPLEPYQELEPTTRLLHFADPETSCHTLNIYKQRNPVKVS